MGARPIAQLNSLRFGHPDNLKLNGTLRSSKELAITKQLGIPVVVEKFFFDECYQ